MAGLIYGLCALVALGCAFMLLRGFSRGRSPLLLWSGLCFVCLALSNVLLVMDRVLYPLTDLSLARQLPALAGLTLLLYGLIWEER